MFPILNLNSSQKISKRGFYTNFAKFDHIPLTFHPIMERPAKRCENGQVELIFNLTGMI